MKIIALDPGGETGVASVTMYENGEFSYIHTEDLVGEHHYMLYNYLYNERPNVIVYERFVYQNRKKKVELVSREYIGVVKLYSQVIGTKLAPQMAADAKNLWTDDKLKALGLWVKGSTHQRDATRHLLHFITNTLGNQEYVNELRRVS